MTTKQATCEERVSGELQDQLDDLRRLWAAHCGQPEECEDCDGEGLAKTADGEGFQDEPCEACDGTGEIEPDEDGNVEDLGNLYDYGLCFDYVAPGTFEDQDEGYFRYQLSWGGPSDEFRIFADQSGRGWSIYRIEYWFLDWYDGASRRLHGEDLEFMRELVESFFEECGSMDSAYEQAMED
jgi:hypothetical protein